MHDLQAGCWTYHQQLLRRPWHKHLSWRQATQCGPAAWTGWSLKSLCQICIFTLVVSKKPRSNILEECCLLWNKTRVKDSIWHNWLLLPAQHQLHIIFLFKFRLHTCKSDQICTISYSYLESLQRIYPQKAPLHPHAASFMLSYETHSDKPKIGKATLSHFCFALLYTLVSQQGLLYLIFRKKPCRRRRGAWDILPSLRWFVLHYLLHFS